MSHESGLAVAYSVDVATGARAPPNRSPAGSWELPKSEKKKIGVGWRYQIILAKHRGV